MRRGNTGQERSNDVSIPGEYLTPGIRHFKERTYPATKGLPHGKRGGIQNRRNAHFELKNTHNTLLYSIMACSLNRTKSRAQ